MLKIGELVNYHNEDEASLIGQQEAQGAENMPDIGDKHMFTATSSSSSVQCVGC